jgi:hypothetical protein
MDHREVRRMTTRIAYESPLVTLWEGDCAEVIADLPAYSQERPSAFHLLATDPPYGVGWQSNARIKSFDRIAGDDGTLDVPSILGAAVRALPLNRHVYVFGYTPDQLAAPMALSSTAELVWDKILPSKGDLTLPYATSFERLTFGVHGKGWKSTMTGGGLTARMRRGAVLRVPRPNGRAVTRHPTEKPVALMRQLVESSSLPGDVVFDPFAGCGSTLVAAVLTGRRALGVELDPGYVTTAIDRIKRAEDLAAEIAAA